MEATYCIGSDTDFSRMFDQYLYKRESSDLSLSMPTNHNGVYPVNEQTFHTPSFGDEDFDITHLGPPQTTSSNSSQHPPSYQHTQVLSNHVKNEPMSPRPQQMCNTNGYHYMSPPLPPSSDHNSHNMGISVSANYTNSHQQPAFNSIANNQSSQLLLLQSHHQQTSQQSQSQMHQPTQQPSHYNVAAMRSYAQSPQANSPNGMASTPGPNPPGAHETTTTSDDSDDSTPHTTLVAGMKRPSPEPIENDIKIQKKPKPTKKKKKRDPNEPQKPVSAYALFFRDTQAAIKGQHPNTSFGEVSKIVASMWDGLDAEAKNVYKKKTETAKKDYLKALAAYRATLVSKGAGENDNTGYAGGYGGYGGGYSGYSPPAGLPSPPIQSPSSHQQLQHGNINNMNSMNSMNNMNNMNKKSQMIMTDTRLTMNGHQSNMMNPPSHMTQTNHIDHTSSQQQQQQQQSQQPPQVNAVPQQQNQSLNSNYPHQSWSWCYRLGPSNQ